MKNEELPTTKKEWLQKNIECTRKIAKRTKDKELAIALEKFIHRCEKEIKEYDQQIQ